MKVPIEELRAYAHRYHSAHIVTTGFGEYECQPYSRWRAVKVMEKAIRLGFSVSYDNKTGIVKISY